MQNKLHFWVNSHPVLCFPNSDHYMEVEGSRRRAYKHHVTDVGWMLTECEGEWHCQHIIMKYL